MKFEIKETGNGFLIQMNNPNDPDAYCYQEIEGDEHEAFCDLIRMIIDNYGPQDDRYSVKRIYTRPFHGDKYDCPNKPCEYCLPEDWL